MPSKEIIRLTKLINRFAEITISDRPSNKDAYESFKRHFRAILNEMDGDYMTLKIKGMNKSILKEFSLLYHNLLELFKKVDDKSDEGILRIIGYVFSKATRNLINNLETQIQQFLKENEVGFFPGKGLSQAKVQSLQNLLELITNTHKLLVSQTSEIDKLKNEKEDYSPIGGSQDVTKIEKKL